MLCLRIISNLQITVLKEKHENVFDPFQRGDRLHTSESDVFRRRILTSKDGPRTERIKNNDNSRRSIK